MCGIVGHVGPKDSVEIVLKGLARLEYRGYDSAGVSFIDEKNNLQIFKKEGKLENLLGILKSEKINSEICIGHTRWATHGQVNDENSHPHQNGDISLVHNGIIENADEIRKELRSKGFEFKSETDTEVFLGLIVTAMSDKLDFKNAIASSFKRVEGNSAFVIMHKKTKEIFAVKRGAPLVCGIHDKNSQALVSSDPYALADLVNKLYFPEDEVLCSLSGLNKNLLNFYELDTSSSKRYLSKEQEISYGKSDKGEFEHYMLKEIYEQPGLIRALTGYYLHGDGKPSLEEVSTLRPESIHITACGTAAYAGAVIKDYLEHRNKIPVAVELASEFRYRNPLLRPNDLGMFISQSGETADTLAAQGLCTENKIKTLSIVNVEGSSLYRGCNHNLLIRAGVEIGVASTKAFTQQVLTGYLFSCAIGGLFKSNKEQEDVDRKFKLLATRIDDLLSRVDEIKKIAEEIYNLKGYFFTGRGIYYPVALEGALKLKEIAYVHAEGYAAGELKHGPIALIDEGMVNIAIIGPELFDKTYSNIQEIKTRKGIIVSIGPKDNERLKEVSDYLIELDFEGLDELSPLFVNIANQLLAYYMAKFKGTDIDKPRNLAKSVTVE